MMSRIYRFISFILIIQSIITLLSFSAYAKEWKGHIVGVSDGDTATLLTPEKQQMKVRLAEIDAPEKNQPFGMKSKQMLSDIIYNKDVLVIEMDTDRYGRLVGRIYLGSTDVNLEMVKHGGAWAYRQYLKDQAILQAEEQAKASKLGLWQLQADQITPPWEWRRLQKNEKKTQEKTNKSDSFSCSGKSFCKEMSNCAEARFYLRNCGLKRLDTDNDGIPCEAICL